MKPVPRPTPETQPFWDGTAAGELRIQRCMACARHYFYPRPGCPHCGSADVEWVRVSGRATFCRDAGRCSRLQVGWCGGRV
ncbi:zinc ribbon domain-containing protein [Nonomuraea sp. NPDC049158]|uniref:Zn-ribbon domain-containing OB-fold protein n=1 Tax=Nonomuraea sp. NPDC049158 TaxID=3155649 RepID=UPI0033DAC415